MFCVHLKHIIWKLLSKVFFPGYLFLDWRFKHIAFLYIILDWKSCTASPHLCNFYFYKYWALFRTLQWQAMLIILRIPKKTIVAKETIKWIKISRQIYFIMFAMRSSVCKLHGHSLLFNNFCDNKEFCLCCHRCWNHIEKKTN